MGSDAMCFLNFAEGTYLLARHVRMLEYQLTVLQNSMLRAGQKLRIGKCEIMYATDADERPRQRPRPCPWSPQELREYRHTRVYPGNGPHGAALARMDAQARMASGRGCPPGEETARMARDRGTMVAGMSPHGVAPARMASPPREGSQGGIDRMAAVSETIVLGTILTCDRA